MRLLKRILKQQTGQALPLALVLLLFGGFFVVPCLALMSTSLNANRMVDQATLGLYAADSGVEDAMRQLKYTESGPDPPSYNLGENVNSMNVEVVTNEEGTYTLYAGEFITLSNCAERIQIQSQIEDEPPAGDDIYKYTITVQANEGSQGVCGGHIMLIELGTLLPAGYTYVGGSSVLYAGDDQLSINDPQEIWDGDSGAWILKWEWGGAGWQFTGEDPNAPITKYQRFRITGTESLEGYYSWIEAKRQNIGEVGEITGTVYTITATASQDGKNTARVTAEVLRKGVEHPYDIEVVSWQVTK